MFRRSFDIAFYFYLLTVCSTALAQSEPRWVEIYTETSRHEEANVILVGQQSNFYIAGIDENNSVLQTELHSVSADGARRWQTLVAPQTGTAFLPFGLRHSPSDLRLLQLGATESTSTDFGRLVLVTLDTLTGVEQGDRTIIELPLGAAYRGNVFVAADEDWFIGGEALDGSTKRFRRFLARVTTEGVIKWTHYGPWRKQLEDVYRYTDALLLGDTAYISSQAPQLTLLEGLSGNQLATIAGPVSWNKTNIIGDTRIFARDQKLWWVTCVDREVRIEELIGNQFETFSNQFLSFTNSEYVNTFYDLRIGTDETLLITGKGPHVGYFRYDSIGQRRNTRTAYARGLENPTLRTRQAGAVLPDGSVLSAGRWTFNRSYINYDATIWRFDIENLTAPEEVVFYGGFANATDGTALDLLSGQDQTVEVILGRSNTTHSLRLLTKNGESVSEAPLSRFEFASGYHGSGHASNGDLVRLASLRGVVGPTLTSVKLVREDLTGAEVARTLFGAHGGTWVIADEQNIRPAPGGGYYVFFTDEYLTEVVTDIIRLHDDLSIVDSIRLTDSDRLAAVSDVMPVEDGSGDLVIYGSTGYTGYDPEYAARIDRRGNVVWRHDFAGSRGNIESILDVTFLDDNQRLTVRTDANRVMVLSLVNGSTLDSLLIAPICPGFGKIDTEIQSDKVLDFCRDTLVNGHGFAEETVDLVLQDFPNGVAKIVGELPRGYNWNPTTYLEVNGQSYIGGSVEVGFRDFPFVMAFNDVLSPTDQVAPKTDTYHIYPNPIAAGGQLNIEGFLGGEYYLYDIAGVSRTLKSNSKNRITIPSDLTKGIYFLAFKARDGTEARARIIIL